MPGMLEIQVDLCVAPTKHPDITQAGGGAATAGDNCFTRGDAHGSVVNVLHFLGTVGAVDVPADTYGAIRTLYLKNVKYTDAEVVKPDLAPGDQDTNDWVREPLWRQSTKYTRQDIENFKPLLKNITVNPDVFSRLIGDVFADRGKFDFFTLLLLKHLQDEAQKQGKECPFEIIVSNHDLEFIKWCEDGCPSLEEIFKSDPKDQRYFLIRNDFANSLLNLILARDSGAVTTEEILDLYRTVYRPQLRLFACDIGPKPWDRADITPRAGIYSHAIIGLSTVRQAAEYFEVAYKDSTPEEIAATIDAINASFAQRTKITTNELLPPDEEWRLFGGYVLSDKFLVATTWSRVLPKDDAECQNKAVYFVNGHNGGRINRENRRDIDSNLGKLPTGCDTGFLKIITSKVRKPA